MTTIMGYLDGLLDGIADTPERRLRYLQAIKTRTGNLVSFVDSFSEYSRLDREKFKWIFNNLFANTVRYRKKENSRVIISLKRTLEGSSLELVFQDDGPGVPEESLEQIFDSFYRVDDSRNSAEKGSGIGLAVVKEIIIGHGGTIRAENRGGLAVIIRIPVMD